MVIVRKGIAFRSTCSSLHTWITKFVAWILYLEHQDLFMSLQQNTSALVFTCTSLMFCGTQLWGKNVAQQNIYDVQVKT